MSEEDTLMLSSYSPTSQKSTEEDSYSKELLPLICCAILVLSIVMIVLLLMLSGVYYGAEGSEQAETEPHKYLPGGKPPSVVTLVHSDVTQATQQVTTRRTTPPTTKAPTCTRETTTVTKKTTTTTTKATTQAIATSSTSTTTTSTTTTTTTSTTTTTAFPGKPSRPGKPPRRYTLICAFEYLVDKWPSLHQCTDYVYMRTFNYQKQVHEAEKILFFGPKRKKLDPRDSWNIYYDDNEKYWFDFKRADMRYAYFKRQLPHADWYLGMWGQTYVRLLNNLWPTRAIMKGLHNYVRSNMSSRKINTTSFEGFAILNTLIIDSSGWHQANESVHLNIFRNDKTPILMPGWLFIHTAAIWPYGEVGAHGISNDFIKDVINSADIVGLSTHNSSEEPHVIYYDGFTNPALFASPPNPIRGATPFVRGMLDIVATFPYWKNVLNRTKLCFSVTTAINYADAEYGMDFRIRPTKTMRMTRRNFTGVNPGTGMLEVESRYMHYEWWDRAATHAFVVRPRIPGMVGPLNTFFAYDDAATLAPKMKAVLDAYPDDRCVVFDDLGDDSFAGNFTYNATSVKFEPYDLLKVVSGAMINKYGGPAFPPEYYEKS